VYRLYWYGIQFIDLMMSKLAAGTSCHARVRTQNL
jgi:hypothetical protein